MTRALAVVGAWRQIGGVPVLRGLTLNVAAGECRALVGMNGAGKTTALRAMLGMLRLDRGEVRLLGQDVRSERREIWREIGCLVETPLCYPELTARENLRAAADLRGADRASAASRCARFAEVLGLSPWMDVPARRLSLGSRQKVGILAALAHRPRLVLLDEPTNALDPLAVVGLREILGELTTEGTAVLVTGHHLDQIARLGGQVDVLHRGRVVETISPEGTDLERAFFDAVLAAERAHGEERRT
ncbi:ABC transporter ATP-binding protein [Brachybacterium sp.]|uniref:ABC transporter ATP-binding protein n=1 Tax=Brachybacterium sp. TaxID=1891286 RepID=UPI002ED6964C